MVKEIETNKSAQGGSGDDRLWKPEVDKAVTVMLLSDFTCT